MWQCLETLLVSGLEIGVLVALVGGGWEVAEHPTGPSTGPLPHNQAKVLHKTDTVWSGREGRGGRQLNKLEWKFFYPLGKYVFIECPPHFKRYSESSKCY